MPIKVLCVAEKPSIARAVAEALAGGKSNTTTERSNGNNKNKALNIQFEFVFPNISATERCLVNMTSVLGHLTESDFKPEVKSWYSVSPRELFREEIINKVAKTKNYLAINIKKHSRDSKALIIWTDCDREGEYIGLEIANVAKSVNSRISVFRAHFSNIERSHLISAARNLTSLDLRKAEAVAARIEIDLRIGAALTRFQTLTLQSHRLLSDSLKTKVISYGSCQFPTLGFIVDRYKRVREFIPENFWYIEAAINSDNNNNNNSNSNNNNTLKLKWCRNHLFDKLSTVILYESCLELKTLPIVLSVNKKPTFKLQPLPLTTVELQKRGSKYLGISSKRVMDIAESLYSKGYISYPRTETDQFDSDMDLKKLVKSHSINNEYGEYATSLVPGGGFIQPRRGTHNDHAHPPIHPVIPVANFSVFESQEHSKVYSFITRHFLASCSNSARGESQTVTFKWGTEKFILTGLRILEKNYLNVYPYEKWGTATTIGINESFPEFIQGASVKFSSFFLKEGKTSPPSYLTEPELISLMDINGIGTDATMAEHIQKVIDREYVFKRPRGGTSRVGKSSNKVMEFIPSTLGVGLVEGYDKIGFEHSLTKPFLRKLLEEHMKEICEGKKCKEDVVRESIGMYRDVFDKTTRDVEVLTSAVAKRVA